MSPPDWGCSSVGRAPALQAGGHRFDPVQLHQLGPANLVDAAVKFLVEEKVLAGATDGKPSGAGLLFVIVDRM